MSLRDRIDLLEEEGAHRRIEIEDHEHQCDDVTPLRQRLQQLVHEDPQLLNDADQTQHSEHSRQSHHQCHVGVLDGTQLVDFPIADKAWTEDKMTSLVDESHRYFALKRMLKAIDSG